MKIFDYTPYVVLRDASHRGKQFFTVLQALESLTKNPLDESAVKIFRQAGFSPRISSHRLVSIVMQAVSNTQRPLTGLGIPYGSTSDKSYKAITLHCHVTDLPNYKKYLLYEFRDSLWLKKFKGTFPFLKPICIQTNLVEESVQSKVDLISAASAYNVPITSGDMATTEKISAYLVGIEQ